MPGAPTSFLLVIVVCSTFILRAFGLVKHHELLRLEKVSQARSAVGCNARFEGFIGCAVGISYWARDTSGDSYRKV